MTSYTYEMYYGGLETTTDCNSLVTHYSGDPLGVNSQMINPDGTITNSNTDWVNDWDEMKPDNAMYITLTQSIGKPDMKVYYDAAGRELRSVTYGFDGQPICVDTKHNSFGQVKSVSEPFFFSNMGTEKRTVYKYDGFHRNNKTIAPDQTSVETTIDGFTTTTTHHPKPESDLPDQQTSATVNTAGWTIESVDANGTAVHYEYYPDGKLKWTQIGEDETTRISLEYDNAGNRTLLIDPNYGVVKSVYNAYGQLCHNTDPKRNTTEYHYDNLGRNVERIETNAETNEVETTNWYYDWNGKDQLDYVQGKHQYIQYEYDQLGRVLSVAEQRDTYWDEMTTNYEYDELSRVKKVTYPTGYSIRKEYNNLGYLTKIKSEAGLPLWETIEVNEFGQIKRYKLGEGIINSQVFDESNRLKATVSESNGEIIQSFSYGYDDFCNLASRKDEKRGMEESFLYDDLNRLTTITMNGVENRMEYDAYGRLYSKMADGQIVFRKAQYNTNDDNGMLKPHAISDAEMGSILPEQSITYTMFDKVKTITQDDCMLSYEYGYDHQRIKMEETLNGTTVTEKDYFGNCEIIHKNGNIPYTYLSGPLGTFAVVRRIKDFDQISFIYKDHLGSWTTLSDYYGGIEQELSFDAWGNLRDATTWSGEFDETPLLDRGFTGHEHLYDFGLINMNGRMYDPIMSSFLSVDNYVQNPDFSQNFNRYAYCLNNPLRYTDPDGEWVQYVIGGLLGAWNGYSIGKAAGLSGWDLAWATIGGAAVGAATVGVGNVVSSAGGAVLGGAAAGATAGAGNGLISGLATNSSNIGQDILNGAWKGLVSGAVGGYVSGNLFTGGVGAFLGGSAANLTGQICNYVTNDNNSINWWSVGLSGLTSFAGYHAMLYQGYCKGGFKGLGVKYGEFSEMMELIQQSMRSGREAKYIAYKDPNKKAYNNISNEDNSVATVVGDYRYAKYDMHTHDKFGCDGFSDYTRAVMAGTPPNMCDWHSAGELYMMTGYSGPKLLATAEGHFWMMNNCTPIPIAIPNGTGFNISFSYSWNPQMVTNYNYSHLFHSYQYNFILKY